MKNIYVVLLCFCLGFLQYFEVNAQREHQEVGLRLGQSSGIMYKNYMTPGSALVGMLTFRSRGLQATVLGEFHYPVLQRIYPNFTFYWGLGGHLGFRREQHCESFVDDQGRVVAWNCYRYQTKPDIGIDGSLGIDFAVDQVPLIIGLEYKPYINLLEDAILTGHFADFALTITYVFK